MTPTRRGALALLGGLAGCGGVSPLGSSDRTELDGAALRALVGDAPTIPERLPVDVGQNHLQAAERRARTLLDAVPANLGADEIPNGAIRKRVRDARTHAAERLAAATATTPRFERLSAVGTARADARFAAAAWRAIDAELTRDDLAAEAATVRDDRRALADRWAYVGGDPVDATVVHAAVERRLASARSNATLDEPRRYRPDNPLGVGEAAEDVERARVAVADAGHFYDRFRATIDDPTDLRSRLRDARTRLFDAFASTRERVASAVADPERPWRVEGVDIDDTPARGALRRLARPLRAELDADGFEGDVARSLLWIHSSFVDLRAFESLRARVADGERFAIESVDDVAAMRTAAVEALRAADEDPAVPALTRAVLAESADRLSAVDAALADADGTVRAEALRHDLSDYLVVRARAQATPPASERVATALAA